MSVIFDAEPSTVQITADAEVVPKGYADLVDRVEALEDGAVDETVIAQAVTDYLDEYGVTVTTDDTLDTTSTNPVQNAPVATAIEEINTELDTKADATVTRTDTTSTQTATSGGTVDVVDSVTTNTAGQVTGINTKTVTLPDSTAVSVTQTLTEGTEIASIDVDGTETVLYAPSSSGGEWELINTIEVTEDITSWEINTDSDGNAFELSELYIYITHPVATDKTIPSYCVFMLNGAYAPLYTNWGAQPSASYPRVSFVHCKILEEASYQLNEYGNGDNVNFVITHPIMFGTCSYSSYTSAKVILWASGICALSGSVIRLFGKRV